MPGWRLLAQQTSTTFDLDQMPRPRCRARGIPADAIRGGTQPRQRRVHQQTHLLHLLSFRGSKRTQKMSSNKNGLFEYYGKEMKRTLKKLHLTLKLLRSHILIHFDCREGAHFPQRTLGWDGHNPLLDVVSDISPGCDPQSQRTGWFCDSSALGLRKIATHPRRARLMTVSPMWPKLGWVMGMIIPHNTTGRGKKTFETQTTNPKIKLNGLYPHLNVWNMNLRPQLHRSVPLYHQWSNHS